MICPLCQKECIPTGYLLEDNWECPTRVQIPSYPGPTSHFVRALVLTDGHPMVFYPLELAIVLPYRLTNYLLADIEIENSCIGTPMLHPQSSHSVLAKLTENPSYEHRFNTAYGKRFLFKDILVLQELIHMDIEEKLRERLDILVLFS